MKIYKKDDKIIAEVPFWSRRINPYMLDENGDPEDVGSYPTLTGLIVRYRKDGNLYDELGFAMTIDRDYKDKGDDVGDFLIRWYGEEEEFLEKCKELGLDVVELNL